MSKYIDAEKLNAEIKRRIEWLSPATNDFAEGRRAELRSLYDFVAYLQQEQDIIIMDKKDWEEQENFWKNKDFGKSLQQKQQEQEAELNADIEMEWDSFNKNLAEYGEEPEEVVWLNWASFEDVARNFYNLGLNARKEE